MIILLEDRDIRVAFLTKMESRGETEGTSTDDDDGIGLGMAHLGGLCVWKWKGVEADIRSCTLYTPQLHVDL